MALIAAVAGRYTQTYNAVDVDITDNGIELQQTSSWEEIATSDAYGDSLIDGVYRGGRCYLQSLAKVFATGSLSPFWPWGAWGVMQTVSTDGLGAPKPLGRMAGSVAAALILTAVLGTPAKTLAAPATLTASQAILAPNNPATLLFSTRLRQVPIRLALLPYETTALVPGNIRTTQWFTTT